MKFTDCTPKPLHSVVVLALVLLSGILSVVFLYGTTGISRFLFDQVDTRGFALAILLATFSVGLTVFLGEQTAESRWTGWLNVIRPSYCAFACLLVSALCVHLVYSGYALSMDEWMPRFQASIFSSGQLTGTIPEEWRPYGHAMFTNFASYDPETEQVASNYRPGMAALIALFDLVGLGLYVSTILNAAAVLLVAVMARQIWPEATLAPAMAAVLLATSAQALAASLTSYAMTAHLCFNLLWLHLFLRGSYGAHLLAACVGVLTASLHQVHMHMFFALPFFFLLLRPFRPGIIATYVVIYLVGHLAVISWDEVLIKQTAQAAARTSRTTLQIIAEVFSLPSGQALASIWANLTRLIAWQNLALLPLLLVLLRADHARIPMLRPLLASILLSLVPYIFFMPDQGHGWGYRYLHGHLGHLAILAAFGWHVLAAEASSYRIMIATMIVVSTLVMLPFRAWQIEQFATPYVRATNLVYSSPADAVIIDTFEVHIGQDIGRNAPVDFQPPAILNLHMLTPDDIRTLCASHTIEVMDQNQFSPLGISTIEPTMLPIGARETHSILRQTLRTSCSSAG